MLEEIDYNGVQMVRFGKGWMEKRLIPEIIDATSGLCWAFYRSDSPMILYNDLYQPIIEIELYGSKLETCVNEVSYFRKHFDYKLQAWDNTERDEYDDLSHEYPLDYVLDDMFHAWLDILELEQNLTRYNDRKVNPDVPESLSDEDLNVIKKALENTGWTLRKEEASRDKLLMLMYNKTINRFNIDLRVPLIKTTLLDCRSEIYDYQVNMMKNSENLVKGCLIDNLATDDMEVKEAKIAEDEVFNAWIGLLGIERQITDAYYGEETL